VFDLGRIELISGLHWELKEIMGGAGAYLICQLGQDCCLATARFSVNDEGRLVAVEDIAFELKFKQNWDILVYFYFR